VKTLKKVANGLIAYNDFSVGTLSEPFKNNYNGSIADDRLIITGGSIVLDAFSYSEFVLDVANDYVPTNISDMGGISINRVSDKRE
jgi:hypothetical protein